MGVKEDVLNGSVDYLEVRYMQTGDTKTLASKYSEKEIIEALRNDPEFAETIIRNNPGRAIHLIPKEILQESPNLYAIEMKNNPDYIHYVPVQVRKQYPELCLNIVKQKPWLVQDMPEEMQTKYANEIFDVIAEKSPTSLAFVSDSIKDKNPEKCIEIAKKDNMALEYIPKEAQEKCESDIKDIVKENPYAYNSIKSDEMKENNPEMAIEALKANPNIIRIIPLSILKENKGLCEEIIKNDPLLYLDLPKELQQEIKEPEQDEYGMFKTYQENENNEKKENMPQKVTESKFSQIFQKTKGKLKGVVESLKARFINHDKEKDVNINENNKGER